MGFRAVWDFAPFGISRRLAFRAVWHFAPFKAFRPPALSSVPRVISVMQILALSLLFGATTIVSAQMAPPRADTARGGNLSTAAAGLKLRSIGPALTSDRKSTRL